MTAPTTQQVLDAASDCFREGPLVRRWMQQNRPHICPFDRLIGFVPGGATVLDVGCGDGLFLGLLARLRSDVRGTGFDASAAAISSAQSMAERISATDRLRFLRVDARGDWPPGEFDVVSMIDVLHHVPPSAQRGVIEQAASKVRSGGLFVYKDIVGGLAGTMNRLHDFVVAREFVHYVPQESIEAWAAAAGLQVVHRAEIRLLWYPHLLRVFSRQ